MADDLLRMARAAQHRAARAIAARGPAHPIALALVEDAAAATNRALDRGHPVHAIHPPRGIPRERTQPRDDAETA
ncbi:hypothetical protein AB0M05_35140 [Streptomyces violaceusniger]|uniref:hypothetical protein n=1 Tax=Streptomyces violaceusniger TaxID=68280 RepID=UPI00343B8120